MTNSAFSPIWVGELELAEAPADLAPPPDEDGRPHGRARLLVRVHGTPVGFARVDLDAGRAPADRVRREAALQLDAAVRRHLQTDGLPAGWDGGQLPQVERPRCAEPGPFPERAEGMASVVVCTRDRAAILPQALRSILGSDHPEFEIVVVDNAPTTSATRDVVEAIGDPRVRYVLEPRGGMSPARNAGFAAARGDLIVFTDDDVRIEPSWLRSLLTGFTRAPHVGCVSGPVIGAELATPAQWYFESRVNWSKLLEPRIYDLEAHRDEDDPMFPFRAGRYGTGANFAVTREAYGALDGMDLALGAGTPTLNGEDLDFFLRVLLSGRALAVESRAIVWHWHRREVGALQRQMRAYGVGLSAYACKHLLSSRTGPAIARRIPSALRAVVGDTQAAEATEGTPPGAAGAERRGLLTGAPRYLLSRLRTPGAMPITGPPAARRPGAGAPDSR